MGFALRNTEVELELAASVRQSPVQTCDQGEDRNLAAQTAQSQTRATGTAAASTTVRDSVEQLRTQVAERLAAHRNRRGATQAQADGGTESARPADSRSARIAAVVAERYANTPSYRAMLAAEADRVILQARAAAEVAAMNAQAIAAAQQRLLAAYDEHASREAEATRCRQQTVAAESRAKSSGAEIRRGAAVERNLWPELDRVVEPATQPALPDARVAAPLKSKPVHTKNSTVQPMADRMLGTEGFTVRLYEDGSHAAVTSGRAASRAHTNRYEEQNDREAMALDEEIAFRQAPVFEEPAGPPEALPANLIEFPRQLVAARKARPRYAEGPLREEMKAAPGDVQLRIFEVAPEQISTTPAEAGAATAQWTSIWLDGPAEASDRTGAAQEFNQALDLPASRTAPALSPASLARRSAAAAINFAVVLAGLGVFAAGFVAVTGHGLAAQTGLPAPAAARQLVAEFAARTDLRLSSAALLVALCLGFLTAIYHAAFAWFSDATPGMRAVRIALCTFEDVSPTRRASRRRQLARLVSACALGMGFAWAAIDDEQLTWHDRMSRMYLRKY